MNDRDLSIRWTKGTGPGGQNKNKLETCCVLTHKPTGETVTVDGRKRSQNLKRAKAIMKRRLVTLVEEERARKRKARRDEAIHNSERIRTYDFSRNLVTDHRTGKKASIKDILEKGKIDKLR